MLSINIDCCHSRTFFFVIKEIMNFEKISLIVFTIHHVFCLNCLEQLCFVGYGLYVFRRHLI